MSSTTKVKPKRKPKKDTTCIDEEKDAKRRKLGPMFGGALEEDIRLKTLPDLIKHGLDILFVGINPGLYSTHCGHYYVKKGNHFWPCITQSGLVPAEFGPYNDVECLDHGIGFSDMVKRCTRKQSELTTAEFEEGVRTFREKLKQYQPLICVFNGIQIYERFSKEKKVKGVKQAKVKEGLQELKIEDCTSVIYVMPSSSPLTAHLPTPQHKMKYFVEIKELLRTMKGGGGVTSKYFNAPIAQNGVVSALTMQDNQIESEVEKSTDLVEEDNLLTKSKYFESDFAPSTAPQP